MPGPDVEDGKQTNSLLATNKLDSANKEMPQGNAATHNTSAAGEHGEKVVNRVFSRADSTSSSRHIPPPDGGLTAWLCVLGTHLVVFNTCALGRSPSDIAWIGSIEIFLLLFIGSFTGRLTDAGSFRVVVIAGVILILLGTFTASVCTQYWHFLLAQGVCVGLGNGCLFCPTIALVSTYFYKKRAFAIGLTACGGGVGGIVFPIIVRELLPRVGFPWTMRAIGFIQAGTLILTLLFLKPRVAPRKTGPLVEWAAFKELEYTFYALGVFFFARDIQGMSYSTSLELVMIMNGVGTIGRLLPNFCADRFFGTLTVFVPTAGAASLLMYCWLAVSSPRGLYAWVAMCGIALGGIQSLFPSALASLTTDLNKQGTRIGMVFSIVSFSVLIGPPIAGALISELGGRYVAAQYFAGSTLAVGTAFISASREVKRRRMRGKIWTKV